MFLYGVTTLFILYYFLTRVIFPFIYFFQNRKRMHQLTASMPGPSGYPLIGCGHLFLFRDSHSIFTEIQRHLSIYHSPAKMWFGPLLVILIDNPEDLQVVLNSPDCLEKASIYKFFNCPLGLFEAPVHLWKIHRRQLNQCFSLKTLQSFTPTLNQKAKNTVQELNKHVNGSEFDILRNMATTSLAMILATNLQTDVDVQNHVGEEIFEGLEGLAKVINSRIFSIIKHPSWLFKLTKDGRNEAKYWGKLNKVLQIIDEYEKLVGFKEVGDDLWPYMKRLRGLRANMPEMFTQAAYTDEIITILAGGTETTTLTLSFVILMLAMHPEIQENCYNEIQGFNVDEPNWEILNNLSYMEMVIKETLRIFSPGPILGRQATSDIKLGKL